MAVTLFRAPVFTAAIWILFGLCAQLAAQETPTPAEPLLSDFEIMQKYGSNPNGAVPALVEGLKSNEASIRRNAAFALGEIGPDAAPAIDTLAGALKNDPDSEVRRNAAFALGEIGPAAIQVLLGILSKKDSRMRRDGASALVRIGSPAVAHLINALRHKDPIVRRNAADILGRIGPKAKTAIPALEKELENPDKAFCWTVKQALRKIKKVTVENLIDCLNDKDVIIRNNATKALGDLGPNAISAIPALVSCLDDAKTEVRKNASFALAKIGEPAIPALIEALKSENAQTRKNATFSLGEMGATAQLALPALKRLLHDNNSKVRWCADNAIKNITQAVAQKKPLPAAPAE
ncbi:MAG: HEAT repeat domain-containing protein [Deltaproteobacteria bacterium]|nr:HEAT repeat domain-containing protein [Deltaproteobacteria bacterium]